MRRVLYTLLFALLCLPLVAQQAPPTGYVQPVSWSAKTPAGTNAIVGVDGSGNVYTTGSPNLIQGDGGYINQWAPVAMDANGLWHFLLVDSSGNLKVTGGSSYTGTEPIVVSGGAVSLGVTFGLKLDASTPKKLEADIGDGLTFSTNSIAANLGAGLAFDSSTPKKIVATAPAFSEITSGTNNEMAGAVGTGASIDIAATTTSPFGTNNANGFFQTNLANDGSTATVVNNTVCENASGNAQQCGANTKSLSILLQQMVVAAMKGSLGEQATNIMLATLGGGVIDGKAAGAGVSEPANGHSQDPYDQNPTLKLIMASFLEKTAVYRMPQPDVTIEGVPGEEKQASPRKQIERAVREMMPDSGRKRIQ